MASCCNGRPAFVLVRKTPSWGLEPVRVPEVDMVTRLLLDIEPRGCGQTLATGIALRVVVDEVELAMSFPDADMDVANDANVGWDDVTIELDVPYGRAIVRETDTGVD
jgi:hypothetical protein